MTRANVEIHLEAGEAVARLLTRTLTVPLVYFEAQWPNSRQRVDILAVDRAGSGDAHVIEMKSRIDLITGTAIRLLSNLPAHYRWMATRTQNGDARFIGPLVRKLSDRGIGLIGVLLGTDNQLGATIVSKASRDISFDRTLIGDFLKGNVPDIEYGDLQPSSNKISPSPLPKLKVQKYLDEAKQLFQQGHRQAAYLLAWSAMEAAMKLTLPATGQRSMSTPGAMVRTLNENGSLTESEVNALRDALGIRNALVHGLDPLGDVRDAFRTTTAIAGKLIKK